MEFMFVLKCEDEPQTFSVEDGGIVGRHHTGMHVLSEDKTVSRKHFMVRGDTIIDLASLNGTWVNGKRVGFSKVNLGDRIRIGDESELVVIGL